MCDICGEPLEWMLPTKSTLPTKLGKKMASPMPVKSTEPADTDLVEYMREWRRETARANGTPAFMVMSDATLLDLVRRRPWTMEELLGVTGIGIKKAELYCERIFKALEAFDAGRRATATPEPVAESPAGETIALLAAGHTLEQVAELRNRQLGTVVGMVADLIEKRKLPFQDVWVRPEFRDQIEAAVVRIGPQWLKPLKEALPPEVTMEEIRLVVAKVRAQQ
jgi:ATP-dependent DNA helicase RecQ